jgi:hypothetical protein
VPLLIFFSSFVFSIVYALLPFHLHVYFQQKKKSFPIFWTYTWTLFLFMNTLLLDLIFFMSYNIFSYFSSLLFSIWFLLYFLSSLFLFIFLFLKNPFYLFCIHEHFSIYEHIVWYVLSFFLFFLCSFLSCLLNLVLWWSFFKLDFNFVLFHEV